jgi:CRISPR-associated endonuclease Cas2
MSATSKKRWLVCYDIRCRRRLMRVHRALKKEGATVQYSAFSVCTDDRGIARVLARLDALIDAARDDLRAYHIPTHCMVWSLGTQDLPDGIWAGGDLATGWLLARAEPEASVST